MLAVISPAKKLDLERRQYCPLEGTEPQFGDEAMELIREARRLSRSDLRNLMKISDNLADLTRRRFRDFSSSPGENETCPAALAFAGDTYKGLEAESMDEDGWQFAQNSLRILSGLYGLLRPLDLIQPYRLEMGRRLRTARGNNLYEFWGEAIANALDEQLAGHESKAIINLASNEYVKVIDKKALRARLINIVFREERGGVLRTIGIYAKRARGMMARHIIDERLRKPEDLKKFSRGGYLFQPSLSDENNLVFSR